MQQSSNAVRNGWWMAGQKTNVTKWKKILQFFWTWKFGGYLHCSFRARHKFQTVGLWFREKTNVDILQEIKCNGLFSRPSSPKLYEYVYIFPIFQPEFSLFYNLSRRRGHIGAENHNFNIGFPLKSVDCGKDFSYRIWRSSTKYLYTRSYSKWCTHTAF